MSLSSISLENSNTPNKGISRKKCVNHVRGKNKLFLGDNCFQTINMLCLILEFPRWCLSDKELACQFGDADVGLISALGRSLE